MRNAKMLHEKMRLEWLSGSDCQNNNKAPTRFVDIYAGSSLFLSIFFNFPDFYGFQRKIMYTIQ